MAQYAPSFSGLFDQLASTISAHGVESRARKERESLAQEARRRHDEMLERRRRERRTVLNRQVREAETEAEARAIFEAGVAEGVFQGPASTTIPAVTRQVPPVYGDGPLIEEAGPPAPVSLLPTPPSAAEEAGWVTPSIPAMTTARSYFEGLGGASLPLPAMPPTSGLSGLDLITRGAAVPDRGAAVPPINPIERAKREMRIPKGPPKTETMMGRLPHVAKEYGDLLYPTSRPVTKPGYEEVVEKEREELAPALQQARKVRSQREQKKEEGRQREASLTQRKTLAQVFSREGAFAAAALTMEGDLTKRLTPSRVQELIKLARRQVRTKAARKAFANAAKNANKTPRYATADEQDRVVESGNYKGFRRLARNGQLMRVSKDASEEEIKDHWDLEVRALRSKERVKQRNKGLKQEGRRLAWEIRGDERKLQKATETLSKGRYEQIDPTKEAAAKEILRTYPDRIERKRGEWEAIEDQISSNLSFADPGVGAGAGAEDLSGRLTGLEQKTEQFNEEVGEGVEAAIRAKVAARAQAAAAPPPPPEPTPRPVPPAAAAPPPAAPPVPVPSRQEQRYSEVEGDRTGYSEFGVPAAPPAAPPPAAPSQDMGPVADRSLANAALQQRQQADPYLQRAGISPEQLNQVQSAGVQGWEKAGQPPPSLEAPTLGPDPRTLYLEPPPNPIARHQRARPKPFRVPQEHGIEEVRKAITQASDRQVRDRGFRFQAPVMAGHLSRRLREVQKRGFSDVVMPDGSSFERLIELAREDPRTFIDEMLKKLSPEGAPMGEEPMGGEAGPTAVSPLQRPSRIIPGGGPRY